MDITLDRAEIDQALTDYLEKKGITLPEDLSESAGLSINFRKHEGHGHVIRTDVDYVEIYIGTKESTGT
jgi:hypothetical protein